ncbi:hypothetical protein AGDE_10242 [Angomonas deanei]|uniref:Iron-sulfur cluster assembly accessory protein n=1 Tax=Angomonas deanei TaxID=59799 RepID=S9UDG3_9TRYP|nr:hypothetical protein AGDE_10470 [Angomonas deanei]EPY28867.1 hypothetical protein AGDE_10242 [Angomonas deanei]CAD2214515.1 hypothetical protein, conserved [Angomonas deanei]|eukprot:EPY28262.1 hypothetical protein AGDE_10470 [Angomonas deanei]
MFRVSRLALCAPVLAAVYGKSFSVSPRAWKQIATKNSEEGFPNDKRFLRLAIDSGGCHGFLYKFSFEPLTELTADDLLVKETDVVKEGEESTGLTPPPSVVVDSISVEKLENAVLDYHSELKGSAFVVVGNDLVDQSCACALSFSIRKKGGKAVGTSAPPLKGTTSGNATPISRRGAKAAAA